MTEVTNVSNFVEQVSFPEKISPSKTYKILGVRWYGNGLFIKSELKGSEIKAKFIYKVKSGNFIYNRLFAWKGSFSIVQEEFDGCYVSNEFPQFAPKGGNIISIFLNYFFSQEFIWTQIETQSSGVASISRNRYKEKDFLKTRIPNFKFEKIKETVDRLNSVKDILRNLEEELTKKSEEIMRLRGALLQEAVEGKLTKQNRDDEPAGKLLQRVKAEKQKLIGAGKLKKEKELPLISEDEKPFELPKGWVWCRLGEIVSLITKGSSPKWQGVEYIEDGLLFVTSENVDSYKIDLSKKKYVEWKFNEIEPRSVLRKGDFLMNIVGGSIGRTAIYDLDEIANINQAVCLIRKETEEINSSYLLHFFNSPVCISYMFDKQVDNARPNLSMGNIEKFLIPLPPLFEQHRIVAKLEVIMQMVNELEQLVQQSYTQVSQLQQAALKEVFYDKDKEYEMNDAISIAAEETHE